MDNHDVLDGLVQPARLWSRAEVLARPSPVPRRPGVYGWYFRELPWPKQLTQVRADARMTVRTLPIVST